MVAKKSILLTTYHEAFLHRGGGEYEMLEVALNLRKLGFVADIYGPYSRDIEHYDVVLHFSIEPGCLPLIEEARRVGRQVVLWPNFWMGGQESMDTREIVRQYLGLADAVVFKSLAEKRFFEERIPLGAIQSLLVPCGVDPSFAKSTPERLFRESFKLGDYILWVGILEPRKNQLRTIEALRDISIPLVFVGNYREQKYYKACREAAPPHFLFLDPMQHKSDMLRAAIRECSLYIEPSLDPPGKSILEAAVAGANVLTCDSEWAQEHFGENACYVVPEDAQSISAGVARGLRMVKNPTFTETLIARHSFPSVLNPLCEFLENGQCDCTCCDMVSHTPTSLIS